MIDCLDCVFGEKPKQNMEEKTFFDNTAKMISRRKMKGAGDNKRFCVVFIIGRRRTRS